MKKASASAWLVALVCALAPSACGSSSNGGGAGRGASSSGASSSGASSSSASATSTGPPVRLGPAFDDIAKLPGVERRPPPWPPAPKLEARLKAIGLPKLSQEGSVVHIHEHLDLFVDGARVVVPGDIGIDVAANFLTALHTHDTSGFLHVESPTDASYSLGQFFAVWGVPLSKSCIGSLCASGGKVLRAWVDGRPVDADPTRIVLDAHQEIVLAYGTPAQMPRKVPASYDFTPVG